MCIKHRETLNFWFFVQHSSILHSFWEKTNKQKKITIFNSRIYVYMINVRRKSYGIDLAHVHLFVMKISSEKKLMTLHGTFLRDRDAAVSENADDKPRCLLYK